MGKAYANKKPASERPIGDFYPTPKSLVWIMEDVIKCNFAGPILEPCHGYGSISQELRKWGYRVKENDLHHGGVDYLTSKALHKYSEIITNPPFSLWDEFVTTAKSHCRQFLMIGRLNYLGTYSRYKGGLWSNLRAIYVFDRYVDYQTPLRDDGLCHVGAMATGWFHFDMTHVGCASLHIRDVQPYATLGAFKVAA